MLRTAPVQSEGKPSQSKKAKSYAPGLFNRLWGGARDEEIDESSKPVYERKGERLSGLTDGKAVTMITLVYFVETMADDETDLYV
mgnify:CR=1 FL=1